MAFHVACPITCKRICFCALGFPRPLQSEASRGGFLDDVSRVEGFVAEDWIVKVRRTSTIQVAVPRVAPPPPAPSSAAAGEAPGSDGEEALRSAQRKRATMQRKAAAALVVAEDYARRFETGLTDASQELAGVKQGLSTVNVMCRLCFSGENEGSERSRRMLSCKCCGKKYHRNCLKVWAHHRDLFHWSSWKCPSCRICEVCRRTGDPNKFMFCKRCDGAYHCYCQQPSHKNASSGPYLCPKHTKCHSCGSSVPGNGLSTRWFLGYTCCDACGRLFVKRNYCPVCLKVYRDSESTPMVCCDDCHRWVHCQCDGISDERYLQFQVDNNLPYKCPTCRGESYEAKDLEDTVQELWRRRDEADKDLIASLRAASGLPTQDEIFSISPYSDDDENGPVMLKNDYGRSLKFSLRGFVEKSPKKNKELGKKSSKKKNMKDKGSQALLVSKTDAYQCLERQIDARSSEHSLGDDKNDELMSHLREETNVFSSPVPGSLGLTEGICSMNQPGVLRHKFVDEIVGSTEDKKPRVVKIKNSKLQNLDVTKNIGKHAGKSKIMKGPKLVIHLGGGHNRNLTDTPMSDGSSCQREHELETSNGSENTSQQRTNDSFNADRLDGLAKFDHGGGGKVDSLLSSNERGREGDFIKLGVSKPEFPDYTDTKFSGGYSMDGPSTDKVPLRKHPEGMPDISSEGNDDASKKSSASKLAKDSKPLLKLKFKNPYFENQSSWASYPAEEKSLIKGHRSKRKRPPYMEKTSFVDDEHEQGNSMSETMDDANWILKTLGKDAIGKRVEVHLPSDNSWHKGGVIDINETASAMTVDLDDGRVKSLELGKHGIRLITQKHKRAKT